MRYGAQGSLDTLSCELGALPRTAPLYALLPWVMGTAQETTSQLTPVEVAMTTPGQKLKKLWAATKPEAFWVKVKQKKTAEGNMLWTHHQEKEGALAHCITVMYYYIVLLDSNNNSNIYIYK